MAQIGPPFDFSKLDQLLERIMSVPKFEVLVGWPADMNDPRRPDERTRKAPKITNAELAAIHDLGAPNAGIPARPFLRRSVANRRSDYVALFANELRVALAGNQSIEEAYGRFGLAAVGAVQQELTTPVPPFEKLQPETIARRIRQTTKPLIDTGQLRGSVSFVVRGAGETS